MFLLFLLLCNLLQAKYVIYIYIFKLTKVVEC